jgi:hypothetical protein
MELKLNRIFFAETYTIGKLYIDGKYYCDTLEDVVRPETAPKVQHQTAIPFGHYEVVVTMSNRFKKLLPLLLNVPKFDGIRIHSGNTDSDTSGCILVGENKIKGKLVNSLIHANKLTDMLYAEQLKGIKSYIEIV